MKPKTLQQAIRYYSDEQVCIDAVAAMRWENGKPLCPACGHDQHYWLAKQKRWKCKECYRQFSVKLGTIFEDSPISLDKWLTALWMLVNCRNGISSWEVHRAIGITQKSAWFVLHRLRLVMKDGAAVGGINAIVEIDESFIGGKTKNMHKSRKVALEAMKSKGLKNETKTIVAGMLDRSHGKINAQVIQNRERNTLEKVIQANVKRGSVIHTDDFTGYIGLSGRFTHEVINKQLEGYIRGKVHTQGIENFWSCLKRGLGGTYISVEPYHLARYVDEQVFRFNNRKDENENVVPDSKRFETALSQVAGKRLTYKEVTGKVGQTAA